MANEASIRIAMQIRKDHLSYQSQPASFNADVTNARGPSPGLVTVPVAGNGIEVDLSALETPALCKITNLDADNYVDLGIWDGLSFYPLMEIPPGEFYIIRLSRNLGREYQSGTDESGTAINTLKLKTYVADVKVVVEAFDA